MSTPKKSRTAQKLPQLLNLLKSKQNLLIVLQDFPDPDALAAAASLRELGRSQAGLSTSVACSGYVGRAENRALTRYLNLNLLNVSQLKTKDYDLIAMVDTQPETGNNSLATDATVHMVIDHHPLRKATRRAAYYDVRSRYGATSTILYEYLTEAGIDIETSLATGLVYGIRSDTNDLGREARQADIQAFLALYPATNKHKLGRIETARLPREYFALLGTALRNATTYGKCIVTSLGPMDNPDMLGEVADMLLRNESSTWALCYGRYEDQILLSLRVLPPEGNAGKIAHRIVGRGGSGGGHAAMAGGQIKIGGCTEAQIRKREQRMVSRFLKALGEQNAEPLRLIPSPGRKREHERLSN